MKLSNNLIYNFNIEGIKYDIIYSNTSNIKIFLLSYNKLKDDIKFYAKLKSDDSKFEYSLKCKNTHIKLIECNLEKNSPINTNIKYFFYYNCLNNCNFKINNQKIFEDNNRVSFIFKPEIKKNQTLYKDKKMFFIYKKENMIDSGYLFIIRKSKQLLINSEKGFNKFINTRNFISSYTSLDEYRSLTSYKESIKKGFHILDADILFTKDKIPVICHEDNLEKISDGKGLLTSKTFKELQYLNFVYKGNNKENILTLEQFIIFCKKYNVIIDLDLSHIDFYKYFNNTDEYAKIIINLVEKYNMSNSIIFNNGDNIIKLYKLKKFKNDISISISNMNERKNIEDIKYKFNDSKVIIYNMGNLLYGKTINEYNVKYALSLGKKVKAAKVNDIKLSEKLFSWGVNYIMTQKLHPFQLYNEKEEPIQLKCNPFNLRNISECEIDNNINLIDNEVYNIYYSKNIYRPFDSINENPIGEFKYINTNFEDILFYDIISFEFKKNIILLKTSNKVKKGRIIKGIVGPSYDNVAKCYQFNFICKGKNNHYIKCKILKKDKSKIEYEGKYSIYSLENYTYNSTKKDKMNPTTRIYFLLNIILLQLIIIVKIKFVIKKN